MKKVAFITGALLLAFSGGSASAMTYSFAGSADPAVVGAGVFTVGCAADYGTCAVRTNAEGLGVSYTGNLDNTGVDNNNGGSFGNVIESLTVTFLAPTTISNILLGAVAPGTDYEFRIDGGLFSTLLTANPLAFSGLVNSFTIQASYFGAGDGFDSFTLKSFDVAAVPVPAGALLLASALGGLALVRRGRKSTAAAA